MALKTYTSLYFLFRTSVTAEGKRIPIEFKNGINFGEYRAKGCFSTSNEKLQEAIESDPRFGWEFFLTETKETAGAPEAKPSGNTGTEADAVSNLHEAREYLVRHYAVERRALNNSEAVQKEAARLGVEFPKLKLG